MLLHPKYMVLTFHPRQGPLVWRKPVRRFLLHSKDSKPCHICVQMQKCWRTCSHRYTWHHWKVPRETSFPGWTPFDSYPNTKTSTLHKEEIQVNLFKAETWIWFPTKSQETWTKKNELQVQESCWDSSQKAAEGMRIGPMRISTLGACLWLESSLHVQWFFFAIGLVFYMPVSC